VGDAIIIAILIGLVVGIFVMTIFLIHCGLLVE
jgi:hypothetical protein